MLTPAGSDLDRLIVVGLGKCEDLKTGDWRDLGGVVLAALQKAGADAATIVLDAPVEAGEVNGLVGEFAMGAKLRAYSFDTYKSGKDGDDKPKTLKLTLKVADPKGARKAWAAAEGIADGVILARDLVNEPANILGPVEFAQKAEALGQLGVEVKVLGEKEMKKLKMEALLGVAQGSVRPPRLAVMRWNGGKKGAAPLALIGKGVVFDTGGVSIKPAGGMDEMKGDMGGAAAVVGAMHAIAARKAKANVVGVIGLVENMVDGNSQRPGDIVTAMSGTTIEVLNTDAEGRLVLADALWYTQQKFKTGRDDRSGDPDGCGDRCAGKSECRALCQRRRPGRKPAVCRRDERRAALAPAIVERLRQVDRHAQCGCEEHRWQMGRVDHRCPVHSALCRRCALGASRHRRHGLWGTEERHLPELGIRIWRPPFEPAGCRSLRELTECPAARWAGKTH